MKSPEGKALGEVSATAGEQVVLDEALLDGKQSFLRQVVAAQDGQSPGRRFAHVLESDPDLAQTLSEEDRERFTMLLRAPVIRVDDSPWQPPDCDPDRTYGLLVLDGLLGRRLRLGRAIFIELLGTGDIMRPWQEPPENVIPLDVDWCVFSPVQLALLDERITVLIAQSPELTISFAARLERRSHCATYLAAIGHVRRVEERLLAVLWYLGGNWGHVTPRGIRIPFRLTHEVLGELVGAQRPSVTIGLRKLRDSGDVALSEEGKYLLTGSPPDWSSEPEAAQVLPDTNSESEAA